VPYGLLFWTSFAIALFLVNWARPLNSFLDPFGLQWNIFTSFGVDRFKWRPIFEDFLPVIQMPFIFFGLFLGILTTYNIGLELFKDGRKAWIFTVVMSVLYLLYTFIAVWVIAG